MAQTREIVAYRPSFALRRLLAVLAPQEIVAATIARENERSA